MSKITQIESKAKNPAKIFQKRNKESIVEETILQIHHKTYLLGMFMKIEVFVQLSLKEK